MADQQADATDTSVQDAQDTSNEETSDPEFELENMEGGFEDEVDEEETEEEEESDDSDDETDDTNEAEEKSEEDVKEEPKPTEKKEEAQSDEEARKAHNREMAEKRLQEKQAREADIEKSQKDYLDKAEDDKDLALRQLQVDAYNNKVERNESKLSTAYERAIKDFPVLADTSPEIQAEVNAAIDAFQAMHVSIDKFGKPVDVRADFYKHLQDKADSIERLTGMGARKQEQSKSKEKSKTLDVPSRAPKEKKVDPDLEAFDEEANRW